MAQQDGDRDAANDHAEARRLAESCSWTFAKTMPSIPHWYILKDDDLEREAFEVLALHIREHGRVGHRGVRPRKTFMEDGSVVDGLIYWEPGRYRYWSMGFPLEEETIINRGRGWNGKGSVGPTRRSEVRILPSGG